ncbi:MAG: 3'-5' exonuclease [Puia sp.]
MDDQTNRSIIDEDGILIDNINTQETQRGQAGLSGYLQQITLLTDTDQKDPEADTVKLMTIHAAKGLEFSCVFAAGLEESLFPNAMSINTREELEEERRLFYVVITRAKHKLWITYANSRYRFGSVIQNDPSRFIEEIPDNQLDRSYAGGGIKNQIGSSWGGRPAYDRLNRGYNGGDDSGTKSREPAKPSYISASAKTPAAIHIPSADFAPSDTSNLAAGDKVEHQKFGFGEVLKMEGSAHNPIATVNFKSGGEKKIMLNYAKLRIIKD